MDVHNYDLILLLLGLAFFGLVFLWEFVAKTIVSLAMVYIGIGILLAFILPGIPNADPVQNGVFVERMSELAVIISLTGVGLKLDRPMGWLSWQSTWRLLAITMPLSIAGLAIGGIWLAGLPIAAAVMLGAVIAPTDPVLAHGVQVGPIGEKHKSEVRFSLTSEAGLNDGLAFPFVNLAIVLAATGFAREGLFNWFGVDVVWKIVSGTAIGLAIGGGLARMVGRFVEINTFSKGFIAIALTLFSYGATEMVHGYGFIGVFVAAFTFSRYKPEYEMYKKLYDFVEQVELLFMTVLLILLGVAIGQGLFSVLTLPAALLGIGFLIIIRPAAGMLGLIGTETTLSERAKIGWFGIRGIGTFYYLAHGLNHADISEHQARIIWAIAGFIVLVSAVLHGASAHYFMKRRKHEAK